MAGHLSPARSRSPKPARPSLTRPRRWPVSPGVLEDVVRRDRAVVALLLVAVITASWLYLLTGAGTGMHPHEMASLAPMQTRMDPPSAGPGDMFGDETMTAASGDVSMMGEVVSPATWSPRYALLMFSMWWLMMVAMMLSGAAPTVLLHAAVTRKGLAGTHEGIAAVSSHRVLSATTAFLAGYLVTWGGFSLVAVVAQWALERAELLSPLMISTSGLLSSGLLIGAGLWQLTPLKTVCLRQCRSPISFLASQWRPGVGGGFRMGARHGVLCLGCCWFLMALLFFAGVMNLTWIVGIALLVLAEKTLPAGAAFARATGLLLVASGVWVGSTTL